MRVSNLTIFFSILFAITIQAFPPQKPLPEQPFPKDTITSKSDPQGYSITFFNDENCTLDPKNSSTNMSFDGKTTLDCEYQLMFMVPDGGARSYVVNYLNGYYLMMMRDNQCQYPVGYAFSWDVKLGRCYPAAQGDGLVRGLRVEMD